MIVKLNSMYINTDNIVTLGMYELQGTTTTPYEAGLVINGEKYQILNNSESGQVEAKYVDKLRNYVLNVQQQIADLLQPQDTQVCVIKLPELKLEEE